MNEPDFNDNALRIVVLKDRIRFLQAITKELAEILPNQKTELVCYCQERKNILTQLVEEERNYPSQSHDTIEQNHSDLLNQKSDLAEEEYWRNKQVDLAFRIYTVFNEARFMHPVKIRSTEEDMIKYSTDLAIKFINYYRSNN